MKSIDLYSLPGVFWGVHSLESTAEGIVPRRLPKEAVDFCTQLEPIKGLRARGCAGVRLRLQTSTRHVTIKVNILSYNDDVIKNCSIALKDSSGNLSIRSAGENAASAVMSWELPENNREITFYLPWQCELAIEDLQIDDNADVQPLNKLPRFQLIGDSITEGMYAETPEKSYANILGDMLGMEVLNSGVGGLKMEPEFVRSVCDDSADMTLLAFGVNDASLQKEPQQFEADCINAFALLADQCRGKLYVVTPLVWPGEEPDSKYPLTLYREIIRCSAKQFPKITVIEGEELLSNAPENFFDSVHPNSNGMKQLAGVLAGMLGKKKLAYE